ncbi:tRNA (guanine(26)-N(2))-dimethyltransferase [Acidianus sulfidivorans JP7]|uniref:tRNA (guanine(26)-N(2))-dimethyltransferase n=1 Tax=Acidianus sulfidivorans TaxID=312539 RepID=UPI001443262F|nr:tRNA (guanine(26)-N(2))-dimethyltransferase [Acidianus sulfidivorans]QIJ32895.1 tRNA (guanine(26)-N(2))-dimethyltransferase [Acidianus sulfidivorans JP7]
MNLRKIKEGKAEIFVPDPKEYEKQGKFDPAWAPVFYNPKMVFNRDISVIAVSIISPKRIIDALSASGIRGIRYKLESSSSSEIILNDKNPMAVDLIKKNVELNKLNDISITRKDANALFYEIFSDFIDVDPFGSPSPFILSSINAVKNNGYVAYTATDLSPLEGRAVKSCKRKYDVENTKLSFSKEVGIRVLISKIVREASILEKTVKPVLSFYHDYYYRIFLKVTRGAKKADENLDNLGYAFECDKCGFSSMTKDIVKKCPVCGNDVKLVGKIWLGKLNDDDFLHRMYDKLTDFKYLDNYKYILNLISTLINENKFSRNYINIEFVASRYRTNVPARRKILECLNDASETHFDPKGIKTDKNFNDVVDCIKTLSN